MGDPIRQPGIDNVIDLDDIPDMSEVEPSEVDEAAAWPEDLILQKISDAALGADER